jgi:hypothetical protein
MFRAFSALACPKVAFAYASQRRSHSSQPWTRKTKPLCLNPALGGLMVSLSRSILNNNFPSARTGWRLSFGYLFEVIFVHMTSAQARLREWLDNGKRAVRIAITSTCTNCESID